LNYLNISDNPINSGSSFSQHIHSDPHEFPDRARAELLRIDSFCVTLYGKVVFIGRENVGKTTLIKSLQIHNPYSQKEKDRDKEKLLQTNVATNGVDVTRWVVESHEGKRAVLNLYDFAGQSLFYATHQYFLSPHSLFILTVSLSPLPIDVKHVRYWLQNVTYSSPKSDVIVVATHREKCGLTDLEISAMLRETFHSYVAEFPILKKVLFVDSVTGYHVNTLVETILTFVSRIQEQNRPIPMKFEVLLSALMSYRVCSDVPCMRLRDLEIFADQIGIHISGVTSVFVSFLVRSGNAIQVTLFQIRDF
jgi:GTPase SAR1 family protein